MPYMPSLFGRKCPSLGRGGFYVKGQIALIFHPIARLSYINVPNGGRCLLKWPSEATTERQVLENPAMKAFRQILPGLLALDRGTGFAAQAAARPNIVFGKTAVQFWQLLSVLTAKRWVWKAAIAGLCGNITHTLLMLGKAKLGILESFQPYQSLQIALSYSTGENIHPLMPWLLSYINGSTVAGFTFANFYHHLPGDGGPIKGFIAGIFGWLAMDLIFFPLLGLGPFAMHLGLGIWPALFSLGMMLAYSIVMGLVYGMMDAESDLTVRNAICRRAAYLQNVRRFAAFPVNCRPWDRKIPGPLPDGIATRCANASTTPSGSATVSWRDLESMPDGNRAQNADRRAL
jgi:hypothetical protein